MALLASTHNNSMERFFGNTNTCTIALPTHPTNFIAPMMTHLKQKNSFSGTKEIFFPPLPPSMPE
jgi:hypothetical protein